MVFNPEIERLNLPEISACYQVVATRRGSLDEVEVKVVVAEHVLRELGLSGALTEKDVQQRDMLQRLRESFAQKTKNNIGLSMRANLFGSGQLACSKGGKASRVRDLRELK